MPAPLFKRFVPPPAPVKKQPSPAPIQTHAVARPIHAPEEEVAAVDSPKPSKKPKKRKREADVANDQDEEVSKKHKNILSKFEKAAKLAEAKNQQGEDETIEEAKEQEVLHDLEPMPQPAPIPEPVYEPTFSTLPTWLAQPTTIEASKTVPFSELGVDPFFAKTLQKQGFKDALAVQTALVPMLHTGFEQHLGDICVSAKTGSGKTLAYLLPIIEQLKDRTVPVLSAIVVVPSRQLVNQALQVAEELCSGTKIKVGTALGNVAFATEQKQLIKLRPQYDPRRARELNEKALRQYQTGSMERRGLYEDLKGRLVEHIENTTGFLLNAVRWLVIDEADQLLNQNFQGWANVLMDALHGETPVDLMNAQERIQKRERDANSIWSIALPARRQLTKVVLSATMEKDVTKLGTLRLKRPKLVVVQDETAEVQPLDYEDDVFELPSTLEEFAVHVGDGSNKPLHLLYILLNYVFPGSQTASVSSSDSSASDSSSDSDSDSGDTSVSQQTGRVLIFTKSTENASRKLLKSFSSGAIKILIASDAASRGLDIPDISHVINYDLPTSITSYVHRVGRTARAGKPGEAWTLFTKTEAAWFLKQVAKGDRIKRGSKKVKRMEWNESTVTAEGRKKAYRTALKQLETAVTGSTETQ
ncbi:ATP-dependent RNA helicase DBP6 [Pyrenophora tritici-repentis Pt-1C-BFP]|uniref:ATP-dependent RNA helicase n=1 Tax=Pyrenophora tritici-repentis (strain Pt-1C-BFP) TaxID=426418 RepID=B2WKH9_PYRTR|nr:ATP-dependent RNA helicase DBP6 [Pyrenophora tritici-repentis Pt-1C-BFP]EDU43539.1 ATP-dependent RNA helicase DBP6 [Pyrenophora tritici-repentis Pt-1C-BFP]